MADPLAPGPDDALRQLAGTGAAEAVRGVFVADGHASAAPPQRTVLPADLQKTFDALRVSLENMSLDALAALMPGIRTDPVLRDDVRTRVCRAALSESAGVHAAAARSTGRWR